MGTSMVQMAHKHVSAVGLQRGNTECFSGRTVIIVCNAQHRKLGCTHTLPTVLYMLKSSICTYVICSSDRIRLFLVSLWEEFKVWRFFVPLSFKLLNLFPLNLVHRWILLFIISSLKYIVSSCLGPSHQNSRCFFLSSLYRPFGAN